ncbi:sulfotransferase [Iodidimonas gelatinilytica]|uniref:Sulfotransferase n=1 Tax=Iodidimonas gelatinilytica TaxID=1236966 RepID=A0A5A7MKT6_9PROT|nr:sulfotransferase [Iodidimonas gelatinilytica]GEQ96456.1 sulfotransferase [Iodidimonas gelatinilytica]
MTVIEKQVDVTGAKPVITGCSVQGRAVPNFFIVGAPKCATTAMDTYLAQHPQIFMSPAKEPHHFAKDLYHGAMECSAERYFGLFKDVSDEPVVGESSVFYLLSKTAAAAIRAYQPDARILIMLRDPIDVIASHHSQIVYEAFEQETDLETALALENERKANFNEARADYRERVLHYRDVVAFSEQIERFFEHFPREQIHIVFYEDVRADLAGTYRGILKFLGVDPEFHPNFQVENANKRARSAKITNFLRYTPDWVSAFSRLLLPKREWRVAVKDRIKRFNTQFQPRPPMPDHVHNQLAADLALEVEKLGALLGRDLSHWCKPRS